MEIKKLAFLGFVAIGLSSTILLKADLIADYKEEFIDTCAVMLVKSGATKIGASYNYCECAWNKTTKNMSRQEIIYTVNSTNKEVLAEWYKKSYLAGAECLEEMVRY